LEKLYAEKMGYDRDVEEMLFLDRPYREVKEYVEAHDRLLLPDFKADKPLNDWRNFVPFGIRGSWGTLSLEERVMCFVMSVNAANRYSWD
jgi:hypothetical protein